MQLKQLEYLVSLSETKSMTTTGNLFYCSHQNISKNIRSLEKELGVTLLNRSSKGIFLTPVGEKITYQAKQMLLISNSIGKIASEAKESTKSAKSNLNMIISNGFTKMISTVQREFEKRESGITIFAKELEPFSILQNILNNEFASIPIIITSIEHDDYIQYSQRIKENFEMYPLGEGRIVLIASKLMQLDPTKAYTINDLASLPLIFYQDSTLQHNIFYNALSKKGLSVSDCYCVGSQQIAASYLLNGLAAMFAIDNLFEDFKSDIYFNFDQISITPEIRIDSVLLVRNDAVAEAKNFADFFLKIFVSF